MTLGGHCSAGLYLVSTPDLSEAFMLSRSTGYDFIVAPLIHPRYRLLEITCSNSGPRSQNEKCVRVQPFTRSDLIFSSEDWSSIFVGTLSKDLHLESRKSEIRRGAEESLLRQLHFASHLGLSALLISLTGNNRSNLARILYGYVIKTGNGNPQMWMRIPAVYTPPLNDAKSFEDTWKWWDNFRGLCNHEKRFYVVLELRDEKISEETMSRWLGEPVKCLIISTSVFLTNKKGFPVLSVNLQRILRKFFLHLKVQVIVEGFSLPSKYQLMKDYLDNLWRTTETNDPVRQFASGYEDYLQSPLQPLMDNLESGTYEVFEKDPIKYTMYREAILQAIIDSPYESLVVMVLGAGRGPLVNAVLRAASLTQRSIRIFAVEKNPNAVVTLLALKEESWGSSVEVICSDMRDWSPGVSIQADIVVSELLGSFGDNELSPECLYSSQHLLKPNGISIPCSYTSFIGPLQSSKLYSEVRSSFDRDKNPHANFETPYVVHLQNRTELAMSQPLFTFKHPCWGNIDNSRYEIKTFEITFDCHLHGFGGYFECNLYKDISISINPSTHSKGMFSWFPIFIPLRTPIALKAGEDLEVHFWRLNNGKNVWYEWGVTKPTYVPIHNPNGRSYTIGL